jgi:hypothetical protein
MSFSVESHEQTQTRSQQPQKVVPGGIHTKFAVPLTKLQEVAVDDANSAIAQAMASKLQEYAAYAALPSLAAAAAQIELPPPYDDGDDGPSAVLLIFIPILVVILTVLLGVLIFLIAVLVMRRQRGIRLTEDGGPLDLSRGDGVIGEGGVEGVESRWLETVDPDVREAYLRTKRE